MTRDEAGDALAKFAADVIDYAQGWSMVDPMDVLELESLGGAVAAWRSRVGLVDERTR